MKKGFLLLCLLSGTASCTTVATYEVPAGGIDFAMIEENDPLKFSVRQREYVQIASINRKHVPRYGYKPLPEVRPLNSEYAILLEPGEHQILVRACVYKVKALLNAGWFCAEAVHYLVAEPGAHYMIKGDIHRKEKYTDFWIENLTTGSKIAEPIRVAGFPESR